MRTTTIVSLLFALAVSLNAAPPARETLWDFREDEPEADVNYTDEETEAVKKYLFGEREVKGFDLSSRLSGSFTRAGAAQTLYYITGCNEEGRFVGNSECAHVDWYSEGWIAVYEGTKPVAKINAALGNRVSKAADVNGDRIHELVSFYGWGGQGVFYDDAMLSSIAGGKYKKIRTFDGYADNCAGGEDASSGEIMATRITYARTKGKMPVFVTEYFQSKCEPKSWRKSTAAAYAKFKKENF
jgi:hypothetical protein